jgi:hypothetical protein
MENVCIFLCSFGKLNGHLVYFITFGYILGSFGTFFPVLCQENSGNPGILSGKVESWRGSISKLKNEFLVTLISVKSFERGIE